MKILVAIPHYYRATSAGAHGSLRTAGRSHRKTALERVIRSLKSLYDGRHEHSRFDTRTIRHTLHPDCSCEIAVCTVRDEHILGDMDICQASYVHCPVSCDPLYLGFECQAVLRDGLGKYDYYCFLEDDIVLHDPQLFAKLAWFCEETGNGNLLQPNRYEVTSADTVRKLYIDGRLKPGATARFQDIDRTPQIILPCFGRPVVFRRPSNPHSGCFFLNAEQMEFFSRQSHFLDRNTSFVSPLESSASLGIMQSFDVYKPAELYADFLEVEHHGDEWIRRLDRISTRTAAASGAGNTPATAANIEVTTAGQPAAVGEADVVSAELLTETVPNGETITDPTDEEAVLSGQTGDDGRTRPDAEDVTGTSILIQTMVMAAQGCKHIRVTQPNKEMEKFAGVRCVVDEKAADLSIGDQHDRRVLIWQRPVLSPERDADTIRRIVDRGYLLVVEYDDDPARLATHRNNSFFTFRACHAVQVSTPRLADRIRRLNPNVVVFPNQIATLPPLSDESESDVVRIFFGALNREHDWAPLMTAINSVIRRHTSQVEFCVIHDQDFFEALETERKSFTKFCEYDEYLKLLTSCQLGLLPLADTSVNRLKSDLKFIEHAACGTAALASPVVYSDTVREGETGLVFRTPAELEEKLTELISDAELRRRLRKNAHQYVAEERMAAAHAEARITWYRNMSADTDRLDKEMKERAPELAQG